MYDWTVENCLELLKSRPEQIEFARLDMEGILLSKRKLNTLVLENKVSGWDDTVMPTIAGLRNRGYTAAMLKEFILRSGFSKANSTIEKYVLDDTVRDVLNPVAPRTMAIINPVELFIENFADITDDTSISCPNHPKNTEMGSRNLTLTDTIFVERDDVRATAENDFWRIYPGNWVRLKHGYNLLIKDVLVNEHNEVIKVIAEIDAGSKNMKMAKHKAKVALHWLSKTDAADMPAYFYNNLTDEYGNYNASAKIVKSIKVESSMMHVKNEHFEFERNGYFYVVDGICHCLSLLKK